MRRLIFKKDATSGKVNTITVKVAERHTRCCPNPVMTPYKRCLRNFGRMPDKIEIVDYSPNMPSAWHDLNLAWISEIYVVEDDDRAVLTDPQKYLLDNGGAIIIALYNGEPVGTCALRRVNTDTRGNVQDDRGQTHAR